MKFMALALEPTTLCKESLVIFLAVVGLLDRSRTKIFDIRRNLCKIIETLRQVPTELPMWSLCIVLGVLTGARLLIRKLINQL